MFIKKAHQTMGQTARTRTHFNSAFVITRREQLEFIADLLLIFNLFRFKVLASFLIL